jgi:mRNA-degrading endonuclease RelE of RelBE toxin-antitoxin system
MFYQVKVLKKAVKQLSSYPKTVQRSFQDLMLDLKNNGPILPNWPNFSSIGEDKYHCHLAHKWVACWQNEKGQITIEVYYVGSREKAPY